MGYPSRKEINKVMPRLKKAQPTHIIPKTAPLLDRTKFQFCQRFIVYMHDNKLNQVEMARQLGIDKSRVNDIAKCRIELFSLDKLIRLAERLNLDVRVVAA
jgi:predicted XRE-type DNA-binding protein